MRLRRALSQKDVLLNNNKKVMLMRREIKVHTIVEEKIEKLAKHNNHVEVNNKHI